MCHVLEHISNFEVVALGGIRPKKNRRCMTIDKAPTAPLQASFSPCNVDECSKHLMTTPQICLHILCHLSISALLFFFHAVNEAFTVFIVVLDALPLLTPAALTMLNSVVFLSLMVAAVMAQVNDVSLLVGRD
jgi:hypothetical protein